MKDLKKPITDAVKPLRMIFWGGLLCVFDFTFSQVSRVNGVITSGFRFDFLNDFVGMLMITWGVSELAKFRIDESYRKTMKFVFICAVLNSFETFIEHFVLAQPTLLSILFYVLALITLVATVVFCTTMNRLSAAYSLSLSSIYWLTTRKLVLFLWAIPFGILNVLTLGALITRGSFYFNIGLLVIPVWLLVMIPLVHLFVSTNRMRDEAMHSQKPVPTDRITADF